MNTRMSLNMPNEKKLEENNYPESRFQTMMTCFSSKKLPTVSPRKGLKKAMNRRNSISFK